MILAFLCAVGVGFLAARLCWATGRGLLGAPCLARSNYRGRAVPTAGGAFVVVGLLLVESGRTLAGAGRSAVTVPGVLGGGSGSALRAAVLVSVVGFGFLGFLDDVLASGDDRGFTGHLRALFQGRVTTGMLKLVGGAALSLVAVAMVRPPASTTTLLSDAAIVALAANLVNLLDRAPGRAIKFSTALFVLVGVAAVATGLPDGLVAPAVAIGAGLGLLGPDLGERMMLGDTGANPLGAALGLAIVATLGPGVRLGLLGLLLALNLVGERVSFSRVITGVAMLDRFDLAGRRRLP
ncbi:MAG: hypothetical protein ACT4OS_08205 [Acidimicrobiales bacterium]